MKIILFMKLLDIYNKITRKIMNFRKNGYVSSKANSIFCQVLKKVLLLEKSLILLPIEVKVDNVVNISNNLEIFNEEAKILVNLALVLDGKMEKKEYLNFLGNVIYIIQSFGIIENSLPYEMEVVSNKMIKEKC